MKKATIFLVVLAIVFPLFLSSEETQAGLAQSPWPMFQHDSSHSGQSPFAGPGPSAFVKWTFDTGGPIYSSPVLGADGTIYIGSDSGKLFALNPDGTKKWEVNPGGQIHSVPAIDEGENLYFGSTTGFFKATPTGELQNPYGAVYPVLSSPCIELSNLYFGDERGYLISVALSSSALSWFFPTPGHIPSSPIVPFQMGVVYFCSNTPTGGILYAVKLPTIEPPESRRLLWELNLGAPIYSSPSFSPAEEPGEAVLFVGTSQGYLWAFDQNGSLKWKELVGTNISSTPAFSSEGNIVYVGVYMGSDRGKLIAIDRKTGVGKWFFDQCGPLYSSPCVDKNGVIYFGSLDGKVYAINPDGTKKWEIQTGGPVYSSSCVGADGTLYIGSTDGKLYALGSLFLPFPIPTPYVPSLFKVELLSPVGGETLTGGANFTIKWSVDSSPSGPTWFALMYSLDGGNSWEKVGAVSGGNSFSWAVPNVNTSKARIRIYWGTGTPESPISLLSFDESGNFQITSTPTSSPTPTISPSPPLSFPDVPSDYWAYSEIMKLVEEGVIIGYPDGTFKPEFPVTRAEFAKMVLLSLGYSREFLPTPTFPDVDPTEWYYGYVEGAVKHGLVKGYPDGTFKPQGNITIAEILTVIVRAKGWSETSPPGPPPYILLRDRDDSLRAINPSDWYYGLVGAATQNGLLLFPDYSQITLPGAGSGEYEVRFNSPASRAQTVVFLSRLMGD